MDPVSAILAPENWTDVLPLQSLFPAAQPLEVEIGCGKGRFLTARAAAHPSTNFLGIDRRLKRLQKTDKKIARTGLANIRLLRIDAAYAVERLLPPLSVSRFYVFFPDPWPKRRHHKRRLFSPAFMDAACAALVPGGQIHLATDFRNYFDEIHSLLSRDTRFEETPPFEPSDDERSEFELTFRAQNIPISRCSFRKALGSCL